MIWKLLKTIFKKQKQKQQKPSTYNAGISSNQAHVCSKKKKHNTRNILLGFLIGVLFIFNIILAIYIGYIIPNTINSKLGLDTSLNRPRSFRDEIKTMVQESICFNHAQHMSQQEKSEQFPLYRFDLCTECYQTSREFEQFCFFQSLIKRIPEAYNNKFPNSWFKSLNICTYDQLKCNEDGSIKEITLQQPLIPNELPPDPFKNLTQLNSLSLIGNITGELQTIPQTVKNLYLKDTNLNLTLKTLFQFKISHISLVNNNQIQDLDHWHELKLSASATHISLNQPSLPVNKDRLHMFLSNNLHIKSTLVELNFKLSKVEPILIESNAGQLLNLKEMGYEQLSIYFY